LYIGNNPRATGTYVPLRFARGDARYERDDAAAVAEDAAACNLTPGQVSDYYVGQVVDYIRTQPLDWLRLMGRKFALTWNAAELIDTEDQYTHAEWSWTLWLTGKVFHFGVLAPLAVLGVWSTWDQRRKLWPLYGILAVYAASVIAFYVFDRYRYPLAPVLILLAAAGLAQLGALLRSHSPRRIAACALAAVAAAVFCNWPLVSLERMQAITANNYGNALILRGDFEEATLWLERSLRLAPDNALAHNSLGVVRAQQGRFDDARTSYRRALEIAPEYSTAKKNLEALDQPRSKGQS
jgi:tetratricopeptide (TPR) repeat protein